MALHMGLCVALLALHIALAALPISTTVALQMALTMALLTLMSELAK